MRKSNWKWGSALTFAVASVAGIAGADKAAAQQANEPAVSENTVVVTATRREQALQDTPIAITAVGEDQMKQQNAEIRQAKEQSQKAIEATQSIRSAIVEEFDNWREDIKHKISVIQKGMNETYQNTYNKLYDVLESRAACDLSARVRNGRKRLEESGATKTKVEDYCRMDAIESDTRLKEIFTAIVREYAVKYVA